jgi:hypothetical protein
VARKPSQAEGLMALRAKACPLGGIARLLINIYVEKLMHIPSYYQEINFSLL